MAEGGAMMGEGERMREATDILGLQSERKNAM